MNKGNGLRINQECLAAVRKISKAAFDERLGYYCLNFSYLGAISAMSMHVTLNGEHVPCFSDSFIGMTTGWVVETPVSIEDIVRFNSSIEKALSDVFKFIESDHEQNT